MTVRLTETTPLSEAGFSTSKSGRMKVRAISAGLGSSGYYSPEVLEQAAKDQLIAEGTHLYLDHPTDTEAVERPTRSVKDIAAVFTGPATYEPATESLVGEIQVMAPYRDLLADLAPHIGLSIRGSATDVIEGEHDGKQVRLIEGLHSIDSVDFVTRAGRGGHVIEVMESAAANKNAIDRGVSEATVNDTREALQTVLRDAYGGDKKWVYVRDFDDSTVWFEVEAEGDESGIYGQAYTDNDGAVSLDGDRTEVRVVTKYVPVTRPDSTTTTTATESEEDQMGKIQIEEAEHSRLTETAGRVDALQEENVTLKAENTALKEAAAAAVRTDRARVLVSERAKEAGVAFTEREVKGFLADITVTESGDLDEEKFTKLVDEDAAAKKASLGEGSVRGYGSDPTRLAEGDLEVSFDDIDRSLDEAFGHATVGASVKEA